VSKNLVIVESPAKARTIERYLGADYQVLASYGHVRDLPENPGKGKFGVDVDHDFAPEYVISDDRRKQVAEITKAARKADMVFLATDLDREGEAIAWHVAEAANVPRERTRRVTFSEITEPAIREAFANPRDIDQNLVDAQQARRIVDRLVGYTLSPLLSRKVRGGLSAGRVQSVAVRLVVEREREVSAFTAREFWTLETILVTPAGGSVRGRPRADRVSADGGRHEDASTGTSPRPRLRRPSAGRDRTQKRSRAPVHDVHAPAGGQPQALVQPQAHDVDRAAPVRGRRYARRSRRAHHVHANRLDGDRRCRDGRGARRHR
jgi:DNA topoisomerase-1